MKLLSTFVPLFLFFTGSAYAETAVLNQVYNARSSADFTTRSNIIAVVPEGTELEILQRKELPSGNYGLQVRVISVGNSIPTKLTKTTPPFWIYYDMNKTLRVVDLQNKKGEEVENPKDAFKARANQNFQMKHSLVDAKKNTVDCAKCAEKSAAALNEPAVEAVKQQIADIQKAPNDNVKDLVPSQSELSHFLQIIGNHTKKNQLANDDKIAKDVIADCGDDHPEVLIPLVLSMMKEESHLSPSVGNSRRGAEGLMQVMPDTARELHCGADLHNPETNIKCGVKYIKQLLNKHPNDPKAVLEAYNAGPNAEEEIAAGEKRISRETTNYVSGTMTTLAEYYNFMKNKAGWFIP
jgi:hypothetical protein